MKLGVEPSVHEEDVMRSTNDHGIGNRGLFGIGKAYFAIGDDTERPKRIAIVVTKSPNRQLARR